MDPRPLLLLFVAGICYAEEPCPCPKIYSPVCGSNGQTFSNLCDLNCVAKNNLSPPLTMSYEGPCTKRRSAQEQCPCPYNYLPVCGSDGDTYDNECLLDCKATNNPSLYLVKSYDGACTQRRSAQESCVCLLDYDPVCGSDGVTYGSKCLLYCHKIYNHSRFLRKSYNGPCTKRRSAEEPCLCTKDYTPVCGSNGQTFSNLCNLNCAWKTNPTLKVACAQECPCP